MHTSARNLALFKCSVSRSPLSQGKKLTYNSIRHFPSYLIEISTRIRRVNDSNSAFFGAKSSKGNFLSAGMAPCDYSTDESAETPAQNSIPIIDLSDIDGPQRQNVCQRIAEACETWGFFHLINHGIDRALIQRAKDVSTEFFHGPLEEKLKIRAKPPSHAGWKHSKHMVGGNNLIQKDTVEHLILIYRPEQQSNFDRIPQQPPSYRSTLVEYTKELALLGEKLFGILSEMLGLAPEAIQTAMIAGSASQSFRVVMRSNFYGLNEDGELLSGVCHAHSDPDGMTFLLADDAPGLEVRKDGRWVKVDPIPGGLIVNVGDMLELCSNGRYKSLEHRGMPSHKQERLTLATFQGPEVDAVIGPIRSLLDETHPPLYKTSTFGAYLADFVKGGLDGKSCIERHKL